MGFLAAAGLAGLAGGISFIGNERTNAANARMAQAQIDFQRDMSNTQYQRAVRDMQKAGLNPALAYQQGGAGTPQGATATMQNSAGAAVQAGLQAAQIRAQTANTEAETKQMQIESLDRLYELQARTHAQREAGNLSAERGLTESIKRSYDVPAWQDRNRFLDETHDARVRQVFADLDETLASARDKNSRAVLQELERNAAKAISDSWATWFGREVRPYMNDAKTTSSMLGDIMRIKNGRNPRGEDFEIRRKRLKDENANVGGQR